MTSRENRFGSARTEPSEGLKLTIGGAGQALSAAIRARPVDAPPAALHWHPEERLLKRSACAVVEHGGALIETARVWRVSESKPPVVEMVTEFVAQGTQERPEGSGLFAHCRPHPDAD